MFYRLPEKYHTVDAHNHVWFKNGELDETRMKDLLTAADLLGIEKICVSVPLVSPSAPVEIVTVSDRIMDSDARRCA